MLVDVGMDLIGMEVHVLDVIMALYGTQCQITVPVLQDKWYSKILLNNSFLLVRTGP